MKLIPFDYERCKAGDKVVRRDGVVVPNENIYKFPNIGYLYVAHPTGIVGICEHHITGRIAITTECKPDFDLFMAPKTKTYWINIYRDGDGDIILGDLLKSKMSAENEIKIYWEKHVWIKAITFEVEE